MYRLSIACVSFVYFEPDSMGFYGVLIFKESRSTNVFKGSSTPAVFHVGIQQPPKNPAKSTFSNGFVYSVCIMHDA